MKRFAVFRSRTGRTWVAVPQGWNWQAAFVPPLWMARHKLWLPLAGWGMFGILCCILIPVWAYGAWLELVREVTQMTPHDIGREGFIRAGRIYAITYLSPMLFVLLSVLGFGTYANTALTTHYAERGMQRIGDFFEGDVPETAIATAQKRLEKKAAQDLEKEYGLEWDVESDLDEAENNVSASF